MRPTCGSSRSRRCAPTAISSLQMPIGLGAERLLAEHRRAGDERAGDQRPEPAVFGARRRRDRVAGDQSSVAQLPVAGRTRPDSRGPRRCAICSSSTRRPTDVERAGARSKGSESVNVAARRPAAADARADCVRTRARDHRRRRRDGVRRRQRVPARRRAGSVLRAVRVDQLGHRDGAAIAESRRDQSMDAKLGHADRRSERSCRTLAQGAVSLRLLPDAAAARVPVRRQAALGHGAASGRRAGPAGSGSGPGVRAGAAGLARVRQATARRRGCR